MLTRYSWNSVSTLSISNQTYRIRGALKRYLRLQLFATARSFSVLEGVAEIHKNVLIGSHFW